MFAVAPVARDESAAGIPLRTAAAAQLLRGHAINETFSVAEQRGRADDREQKVDLQLMLKKP